MLLAWAVCVDDIVLNNDSVEFTEEYCPSDVMQTLYQRGWVISPEEQVRQTVQFAIH